MPYPGRRRVVEPLAILEYPAPVPSASRVGTRRLRLDPVAASDEDLLYRFFQDDHVRRYMLDGALVNRVWVAGEIAASARRFADGLLGLFAARLRATGELVGVAGFRPDHEPPVMELVYALLPTCCGRGLATEMARAMVELAFHRHGWTLLRAAVDEPNAASIRVLERLGFAPAGESPGAFGRMLHFTLTAPSERAG